MLTSLRLKIAICAAFLAITRAAGCGGGDDATPTPTLAPTPIANPTVAISNALRTMKSLDSYRMQITFSPIGAPVTSVAVYDKGDYFERIPADLSVSGGAEYVYAGQYQYKRDCTGRDTCGPWTRTSDRPIIPSLAGTVNSIPETLGLTAVELASSWSLVPNATGVLLSGGVSISAATQENQKRAFIASGKTPEEADTLVQQLNENVPSQGTSVIEVTLSPDYQLIQNVTIYTPTNAADPYFDVAYTQFNEAGVGAPPDFVPG
jgi:hypothetical protein